MMSNFIWSADSYKKYVGETDFPMLHEYEKAEISFIKETEDSKNKTFIDVGAGYGRVLPVLGKIAKNVIAIEIDDCMFKGLEKNLSKIPNLDVIKGDGNKLSELISKYPVSNPVLVCLQNSIGPWEGDYKICLEQMRRVAETKHGEVILSAFKQEAFSEFAISMYSSVEKVVGKPLIDQCNQEKGIFVSKTGYVSRWWTKEEREEMKQILGGSVIREISDKPYFIFHIKY